MLELGDNEASSFHSGGPASWGTCLLGFCQNHLEGSLLSLPQILTQALKGVWLSILPLKLGT